MESRRIDSVVVPSYDGLRKMFELLLVISTPIVLPWFSPEMIWFALEPLVNREPISRP